MTINGKFYRELRCATCRKLLCFEYIFAGRIAAYCSRCGDLNEIDLKHLNTQENKEIIQNEFAINSKAEEGGEKING